jgi:hypothetical protein
MLTQQYYETEVFDEEASNGLIITVAPRRHLAPDLWERHAADIAMAFAIPSSHGYPISREGHSPAVFPMSLAQGRWVMVDLLTRLYVATDQWLTAPSGFQSQWVAESLMREEAHDPRYRTLIDSYVDEPLVPTESSPLDKESLIALATGGSAALVSAVAAQGQPLLIFQVAAGIILVRVATAIGRNLERAIDDQMPRLLGVRPRKRRPSPPK